MVTVRNVSDFLRIFEGKALAEALTASGHQVSEKTVQRWKNGTTKPKPQDIRAIRALVGVTTKDAPPDESDEAPAWAIALTDDLRKMIRSNEKLLQKALQRNGDAIKQYVRESVAEALAATGERPPRRTRAGS